MSTWIARIAAVHRLNLGVPISPDDQDTLSRVAAGERTPDVEPLKRAGGTNSIWPLPGASDEHIAAAYRAATGEPLT